MNKELQKKLAKILVLTNLLIIEIDDPSKTPNKKTKEIQDKARELQGLLEPVLDSFYSLDGVQKTNVFNTLTRKFDYIFEKEYK